MVCHLVAQTSNSNMAAIKKILLLNFTLNLAIDIINSHGNIYMD